MHGISDVMETARRDPLVIIFALFVLGGLATAFLFKNRNPSIARDRTFVALTPERVAAMIMDARRRAVYAPPSVSSAAEAILQNSIVIKLAPMPEPVRCFSL